MIYDGAGSEPFSRDVGILGDRIAAIGDLEGQRVGIRLDVRSLVVVPGFIDIHSHASSSRADRGELSAPVGG